MSAMLTDSEWATSRYLISQFLLQDCSESRGPTQHDENGNAARLRTARAGCACCAPGSIVSLLSCWPKNEPAALQARSCRSSVAALKAAAAWACRQVQPLDRASFPRSTPLCLCGESWLHGFGAWEMPPGCAPDPCLADSPAIGQLHFSFLAVSVQLLLTALGPGRFSLCPCSHIYLRAAAFIDACVACCVVALY